MDGEPIVSIYSLVLVGVPFFLKKKDAERREVLNFLFEEGKVSFFHKKCPGKRPE